MSSGPSVIRRPIFSKSNIELINSLRANFSEAQQTSPISHTSSSQARYASWTTLSPESDTLYIPTLHPEPLVEPRESYDITCKLFFLPSIPPSRRCTHTKEAINLVLSTLGVSTIDLLIVSYPGVSFDADDDSTDLSDTEDGSDDCSTMQNMETMVRTWRVLEDLHTAGTISQLGVAEFGSDRLAAFLPQTRIQPSVDQINVKDCCVVPRPLIMYAKEHKIELLTHNDCTDILPPGTTRELLGPSGAGILSAKPEASEDKEGLKGDIEPQWVMKYTAVVKNRGVIENKGYFAVAQVGDCIEKADS
jgi:glutamate--cysteine ligase regulatory subunit